MSIEISSPRKFDLESFQPKESSSPCKRKNSFPLISPDESTLKKQKTEETSITSVFCSFEKEQTCSVSTLQPDRVIPQKECTIRILKIADQFKQSIMEHLSNSGNAEKSRNPPTLIKKKRNPGDYEQLFLNSEKGSLMKGDESFNLTRFARGTFMNAYELNGVTEIQSGVSNDKLLIKLYAATCKSFNELKSPEYMTNSIANYRQAEGLGLPVSTIYNIETALSDKFFLVELIPGEVDLGNEHHLKQVQHFIKMSYENKILFDLSFSNLRVREDGTVTLIDFVEIPFNFTENSKLLDFTITYLKSWVKSARDITLNSEMSYENRKELASQLLTVFTEDLEVHGFNPKWNQEALTEYFK